MKKKLALLLVILIVANMIVACSPNETSQPEQEEQSNTEQTPDSSDSESTQVEVKKDTFTVAIPAEMMTLNPFKVTDSPGAMGILNTHDGLVRVNEYGEILPSLAERWELSEDQLSYTFYLRKDVTFHDGTPFTANDVKFSIEKNMTEPTGKRFTAGFKGVDVINDYECVLRLENPMAATINYLAIANNCIVSESAYNRIGEENYKTQPCGTGAFKFKEWIPGDRIIFEANENYFLGAPAIKTLIIRNINDKSAALVALETGDIDAMMEASTSDKETIKSNPDLAWYETPSTVFYSLQVNNKLKPFDDVRVRRAINMAINRDEIIAIALDGQGIEAHHGLSIYSNGYTEEVANEVKNAPYDPEKAKALLAEAGYPDGFDTNIYVRDDFMKKAGLVIQSNLAEVGINAEVNVMERGALITDMQNGKLELPMSMATDMPFDASLHLNTLDSRYMGANGANFAFFSNPEFDRLNKLQFEENDPEKRNEYIKRALLLEKEEVPTVPLFFPVINLVMNSDVKGLTQPYPSNIYWWYNIHW